MIKNQRQYKITKSEIAKFEKAIAELKNSRPEESSVSPILRKAELAALGSQLEDLRAEIKAYDDLQNGRAKTFSLRSLDELPTTLIQARIARKMTQKQLAKRIKVDPQQIQRYEATDYSSANLERLSDIAGVLGITLTVKTTTGEPIHSRAMKVAAGGAHKKK